MAPTNVVDLRLTAPKTPAPDGFGMEMGVEISKIEESPLAWKDLEREFDENEEMSSSLPDEKLRCGTEFEMMGGLGGNSPKNEQKY